MFKKSIILKKVREGLESGKCLDVATRDAGMKTDYTLWRWRNKRPIIDRYVQKCMERSDKRRVNAVTDALIKTALSGNVAAQCFFLKNKAGWKDAEPVQVNIYTQVWNGAIKRAKTVNETGRVTAVKI